ncbi:sentrin-specific protease 5-like [Salarias fasciatus]|uniref:sentrin-specific protease 5-like n=1 Tax=Salarias fasciatus TaxID=181472 RepID=UPI00117707F3|nr:sentrin-specific protease 5-like [Salarias fasciatus]XP_029971044.1 sentrin-specific protease 5-like [Salarias fasciatus]
MHQRQSRPGKVKHLKGPKNVMSSIQGVSHLSRQAKRRLFCKVQFFMWRKRRQKARFGTFQLNKRNSYSPCLSLRMRLQKNKIKIAMNQSGDDGSLQGETSASASPAGGSEDSAGKQACLSALTQSDCLSGAVNGSSCSRDWDADTSRTPATNSKATQTLDYTETTDPLGLGSDGHPCGESDSVSDPRPAQRIHVNKPSELRTATPQSHGRTAEEGTERRGETAAASPTDLSLKTLAEDIHGFLLDFYRKYGSFIPLQKDDVLKHLRKRSNTEFDGRHKQIFSEVARCRGVIVQKPAPPFRVVYKKHVLTLEDLLTLADQNWLNDQVMNMYGELIMESSCHKVHFLNSFFHRQLMTKGYDGVKRWTKKVDLFSKSLLLVPIHLEVHWCLVTADIGKKRICIYDSQGNAVLKVARNILKYLITDAKEKKQAAFENGWTVSFDEKVPQQTNENDCGVFVLEYSRRLALAKPLQFSQSDIPKIRKRIYRELCERKLLQLD